LGGTMYVVTAPSDPLIIRPPYDGITEINHCFNYNGKTIDFVVLESVSVLLNTR
jgi:hypothetical protein